MRHQKQAVLLVALLAISGCATPFPDGSPEVSAGGPDRQGSEPGRSFETQLCRPVVLVRNDEDGDTIRTEHLAEYPSNRQERERGFSHRDELHPEAAMVFTFDGDHNPVMWMKDVSEPLDIAFFDAKGFAFHVEARTTPMSTRFLGPDYPEPIAHTVLKTPSRHGNGGTIIPSSTRIELGAPRPCPKNGPTLPRAA